MILSTTSETLTLREVCGLTMTSRATVYRREADGTFPRRASPPRARVRWLRADIEQWLSRPSEPKSETPQETLARINRLAHAPRAGAKRQRRVPDADVHAAPVYAYEPKALNRADRAHMLARAGIDEDGQPLYDPCKPMRWHR